MIQDVTRVRSNSGVISPSLLESLPGFGDALEQLLVSSSSTPTPAPSSSSGLCFSKQVHARMKDQNIELHTEDLSELEDTISRLNKQGARESLVLMDDHAFLVGVLDRQVIALMTRREAAETIFSQVDSAVAIR